MGFSSGRGGEMKQNPRFSRGFCLPPGWPGLGAETFWGKGGGLGWESRFLLKSRHVLRESIPVSRKHQKVGMEEVLDMVSKDSDLQIFERLGWVGAGGYPHPGARGQGSAISLPPGTRVVESRKPVLNNLDILCLCRMQSARGRQARLRSGQGQAVPGAPGTRRRAAGRRRREGPAVASSPAGGARPPPLLPAGAGGARPRDAEPG